MSGKILTVLGCAGLVGLVGGCPLFDVQVETREVCLHYGGLEVPAGDGSGSASVQFVFEDFASLDGLDQVTGDVELVRVDLTATSGVSDFGFLTAARATVAGGDPQSSLPAQVAVDCSGDGCLRDGARLSAPAADPIDALPYLRSKSVAIKLDVSGTLPTQPWIVDVDVCLKGSVSYQPQI